ncbi:uncharacterized protein LOC124124211 isoform X3 [Haliotis rufescens]|uniref:uncharacterized protein LOC124124211 isoform X3 n=1 Tax=Haliotis rufescens TaxID=6454 RepID=UPI00201E7FC6|nr:uncharacterized protein LOC124124211 isoform X3 [Haliotis rufescens]
MAGRRCNRLSTFRRICLNTINLCCCVWSGYQLVPPDEDLEDEDRLTEDERRSCVSERALMQVSQHIGGGFQVLGLRLGLPYVSVKRCTLSQSSPQMQIFVMLNTWRQLKGRQATVEVLVQVLSDSMSVCTVDMPRVYSVIREM